MFQVLIFLAFISSSIQARESTHCAEVFINQRAQKLFVSPSGEWDLLKLGRLTRAGGRELSPYAPTTKALYEELTERYLLMIETHATFNPKKNIEKLAADHFETGEKILGANYPDRLPWIEIDQTPENFVQNFLVDARIEIRDHDAFHWSAAGSTIFGLGFFSGLHFMATHMDFAQADFITTIVASGIGLAFSAVRFIKCVRRELRQNDLAQINRRALRNSALFRPGFFSILFNHLSTVPNGSVQRRGGMDFISQTDANGRLRWYLTYY